MQTRAYLQSKANSLPQTPGVYLMKDSEGHILYVGKAKKLKNRVTDYFTGNDHTRKTDCMVARVADFDYILCDTEMEALTLENVLIKKHTPKYNIRLKDAKSYPYIKVTAEEYPRLFVSRERKSDRARYFGPYSGMAQAYGAMETVQRIFSLPGCRRSFPADIGRRRPCLYRDMGRCIAPCAGGVSAADYRERIRCAVQILEGNTKQTIRELRRQMEQASENLEFERAAGLRDSIRAMEGLSEKQKVVADTKINRDIFALYTDQTGGTLAVLTVREGALIRKNELPLYAGEADDPEGALCLIADYYEGGAQVPRQVLLDFLPPEEDLSLLCEYLTLLCGHKVQVRVPERGEGRALCDLAQENAREATRQRRLDGEREDRDMKRLCELLGLPSMARRVEAYDISNVGNEAITASMVVYEQGKFRRADYRTFHVRTTEGADDYGSMREVLERRLSHIGDGSPSLGQMPDMILLDGGAAHVRTVAAQMRKMEMDIPLFGMVKDDYHKTRAITDGEREISIAKEADVYALVYKIQEEAHRFAYKGSSTVKIRSMTHSSLEKIPGIGAVKARALLRAMPLSEIRMADRETLEKVPGIGARDAEAIEAYFKTKREGKKEK